jgi:hypothetical protein
VTRGRLLPALVGCALAAACSTTPTASAGRTDPAAAPRATEPYVVLSSADAGFVVWPSGHAWALLGTGDGFRTVRNATPPGVPTDGGLVASSERGGLAVAIGPVEQLLRSPVLTTSASGSAPWTTGELPGGVVASRSAVAVRPAGVTVLTTDHDGSLLARHGSDWQTLVDARSLPGAAGLFLDGVAWASDDLGWVTGHRASAGPVAFQTHDGGHTWTSVSSSGRPAVAGLAPCGKGADWSLPELDPSGRLSVLRTRDGGRTWAAGPVLPAASGAPVWGCRADEIWAVGGAASSARVFASDDQGATWTAGGQPPANLTALTPTGPDAGFAASGGTSPQLWRVSGRGATFTRIALPGWVAGLAATMGSD